MDSTLQKALIAPSAQAKALQESPATVDWLKHLDAESLNPSLMPRISHHLRTPQNQQDLKKSRRSQLHNELPSALYYQDQGDGGLHLYSKSNQIDLEILANSSATKAIN
eukprot:TRINITY_DN30672_c0_g1_i1.p1 TRINITY_DN30672_c0_g1~~TRINITY_DN30672_c0_g1_i1.p1  ORF type:complete len:109 (+),score=16.26 TRINITY_DN30672_c0_g1_i1:229-555(+)